VGAGRAHRPDRGTVGGRPPVARRAFGLAVLAALGAALGPCPATAADTPCGEVVTIPTHGRTTTRYALAAPAGGGAPDPRPALVLLVGGAGHLALDDQGCPRRLGGNSLVRSIPHFHALGFVTALVDAPSDHAGDEGLGGFRADPRHAEDLGKVIADVRARAGGPVWLVGTSRGAISAANAAARLTGPAAPDGLVLTSALMVGTHRARRAWAAQSVFDLPLDAIRVPVLVVGHAEDTCLRSPARLMGDITAKTRGAREPLAPRLPGPGGRGGGRHRALRPRRHVLTAGTPGAARPRQAAASPCGDHRGTRIRDPRPAGGLVRDRACHLAGAMRPSAAIAPAGRSR
jgi:hypothetical protein